MAPPDFSGLIKLGIGIVVIIAIIVASFTWLVLKKDTTEINLREPIEGVNPIRINIIKDSTAVDTLYVYPPEDVLDYLQKTRPNE